MEMFFGNKGINHFLDVDMGESSTVKASLNSYRLKMLEENNIAYLLRPVSAELDGRLLLKYNTGSNYVMERVLYKMKPDGAFLRTVVSQIFECIRVLDRYLLAPDDLVLNPSYMFYSCSDKELKLIYVPDYNHDVRCQMKALLEYIMKVFDHRDEAGVRYMYELYDMVADESFDVSDVCRHTLYGRDERLAFAEVKPSALKGGASVREVKETADKGGASVREVKETADKGDISVRKEKASATDIWIIVNTAAFGAAALAYFVLKIEWALLCGLALIFALIIRLAVLLLNRDDDSDKAMREYKEEHENHEEEHKNHEVKTDVYNGDYSAENTVRRLIPLNNGALDTVRFDSYNEKIVIGRGRRDTDYRVPTTQISRVHACIYLREDGAYLEDLNSTNGTYINDMRLPSRDARILVRGDVISFSGEEFLVS